MRQRKTSLPIRTEHPFSIYISNQSSAGFGGSGGGGPGSVSPGVCSKVAENGEKGRTSSGGATDEDADVGRYIGVGASAGLMFRLVLREITSSGGSTPFIANCDTRASSSCVSWMYSTGGRGMSGGGLEGGSGVEEYELERDGGGGVRESD